VTMKPREPVSSSLPSFSPDALPCAFSCSSFARVRLQKVVLRTGTVPIAREHRTVRSSDYPPSFFCEGAIAIHFVKISLFIPIRV
jgi:hypothetical protein